MIKPLKKLTPLAEQLAATADDQQAEALRKQFLEGYYGRPVRLPNARGVETTKPTHLRRAYGGQAKDTKRNRSQALSFLVLTSDP